MLLGAETEQNGSFRDINGVTRNKLYVACSKAKGNLTFIPEPLLKASARTWARSNVESTCRRWR
ncbi:hypothetical protein C6571_00590 [Simplicispira suum]|uniref:Uncharacterized protein n=1 Tax=Simplicispira suum TaxID=2109915 RepID=A0A2S0MVT2_9BURK|nr:hypothetical protein C6571_00590 [Simplicispira suum]